MKVSELLSRLTHHVSEFGRSEYTCPDPHGNTDPLMHQYMIDTHLASVFKKRREASLEQMMLAVDETVVHHLEDDAHQYRKKQHGVLLTDKMYTLSVDIKSPGMTLNATRLKTQLEMDGRYTKKEIDNLFEKCTTVRTPAKTFVVEANDDG